MTPSTKRRKPAAKPRPRTTWVSHTHIASQIRQQDCSVIGLLAEIAKDRTVEPALRFRAIERLAALQYLPGDPGTPAPPSTSDKPQAGSKAEPVDVGAIIARNWAKDE